MMTKKHYMKIAKILSKNVNNPADRFFLAYEFSLMFQEDNPRFEKDRFLVACKRDTDDSWINVRNPFRFYGE